MERERGVEKEGGVEVSKKRKRQEPFSLLPQNEAVLRLKVFEMLLEQGRMEGKVEEKHS